MLGHTNHHLCHAGSSIGLGAISQVQHAWEMHHGAYQSSNRPVHDWPESVLPHLRSRKLWTSCSVSGAHEDVVMGKAERPI